MENFTPVSAALGGALIGLSAALPSPNGRIDGIVGGLLARPTRDVIWRAAFILGLMTGPLLAAAVAGGMPPVGVTSSAELLLVGGQLVG